MEIKEIHYRRKYGFTLIELLVGIVIAAILLMVAIPSFKDTSVRNNIESQISELHAALSLARSEAVSRNTTVSICRSANQTACLSGTTWQQGWIVFVDDVTTNGSLDVGEEIIKVHEQLSNANDLTLTDGAAKNFIKFGNKGMIRSDGGGDFQNGTFRLCRPGEPATYARGLNITVTGRAYRSRDNNADGIHEDNAGANLTCP